MNITKQRKRHQRPTDHRRVLRVALRQEFKRRAKRWAMFRNRPAPEPTGKTLVFKRFQPYGWSSTKKQQDRLTDSPLSRVN